MPIRKITLERAATDKPRLGGDFIDSSFALDSSEALSLLGVNSPEYAGPQSILGGIGRTLEELTFGGARPVTKTGQGIMDLIQGQDAESAMGGYETFDGKKM